MTMAKSRWICLLGIIAALMGAIGLLVSFIPSPWPHVLLTAWLISVNIGLFWMGQMVSPERYSHSVMMSSRPGGSK